MAGNDLVISALNLGGLSGNDSAFHELLPLVDADKQAKIRRFYRREDAQRALFGELLIRALAMRAQNISNRDISFTATEFGKPFITGLPQLHFNISHSGGWVVCATDKTGVGIDVEQISEPDLSVSENVFCAAEHAAIIGSKDPRDMFFRYWTLKESYIKFTGKGLSQPLNSFGIQLNAGSSPQLEIGGSLVSNVHFKQYQPDHSCHMAVCASHSGFPAAPDLYQAADIVQLLKQH